MELCIILIDTVKKVKNTYDYRWEMGSQDADCLVRYMVNNIEEMTMKRLDKLDQNK